MLTRAGSWLKRATTWAGRSTSLLLAWLVWTLQFLTALFVLAMCLLPTVWQRPKPMTYQRKLPIPVRDPGSGRIYAVMPDGERVEVGPLAAANHARAWCDCVFGGYVFERTKLPGAPDAEDRE